jgi:hypothetical protein
MAMVRGDGEAVGSGLEVERHENALFCFALLGSLDGLKQRSHVL